MLQFCSVDLGPRLDQALLRLRQAAAEALDGLDEYQVPAAGTGMFATPHSRHMLHSNGSHGTSSQGPALGKRLLGHPVDGRRTRSVSVPLLGVECRLWCKGIRRSGSFIERPQFRLWVLRESSRPQREP